MKKHIPNIITLCNLFCGCVGVVLVFQGDWQLGATMIWAGAVFDFFDGFAARMLKSYSDIGKDLDSLADLVTFCFLPASLLYVMLSEAAVGSILPYAAFLLVLFGALRLARFNNDTRQTEHFHGLPVPSSAMVVSALPFAVASQDLFIAHVLIQPAAMLVLSLLLSLLMVSDIRLMSLKFKNFAFQSNKMRYILIALSAILLLWMHALALPLIILLYVVLSVALNFVE